MTSFRIERVNGLLRTEIGKVIANDLADPNIAPMTSITEVSTSRDLSTVRVHVSVLGDNRAKAKTIKTLNSAAGFIQRLLRPRLHMRRVPRPEFVIDESIERGADMLALINTVIKKDADELGTSRTDNESDSL